MMFHLLIVLGFCHIVLAAERIMDESIFTYGNSFDIVNETFGGVFTNLNLLQMSFYSKEDRPFPKTSETFEREYDYIIVGGGTAGAVMANRLSKLPCISVLLLEAGAEAPFLTDVPAFVKAFPETDIDWVYITEPQKYAAFGHVDNRVKWNSGKALGGSSVLNGMLYVRGNKKNYDDWQREGCTGWSYDDVLPYFLKLEDNKNIEELDAGYHQVSGPVTVMKPRYTPEIKKPLIKAAENLGYKVRDTNGEKATGIYDLQGTIRNCKRCSTAKAYLVPAEDRPNLTMLKRAFVEKILFKEKKAVGVQFSYKGSTETVYASAEVIVSSGTVRAPQLLMLSGIGPRKHLEEMNIPVIADLPVGHNLQDHYGTTLTYNIDPRIKSALQKISNPLNILKYIINRSGPLCSPNQINLIGFFDGLNATSQTEDFPRQEIYWLEEAPMDVFRIFNLRPDIFDGVNSSDASGTTYTCFPSLTQPESRGEITLKSTDPNEQPKIDPHYFEDESDLRDVVEAMKICDAIGTSDAMQQVKSKPSNMIYSRCRKFQGNQTGLYECMARTLTNTIWHPVGTCRMGQPNDTRSVVDPQGKVIGVDGLRVVCAAIMPIIPSANTNVPTMMIAEKIADEIKKEISCEEHSD